MHDAKGRELKVGDQVMIPATVKQVSPSADYCNVSVASVQGRRPDGLKETMSAINTGVMFRANAGDENGADEMFVEKVAEATPEAPTAEAAPSEPAAAEG